MEATPTVNSELSSVESQVGPPDCLRSPVILRHILEHFSESELLQLSLVNKEWNFEARSVLRNRGNLIVKNFKAGLCKSLVALASDLKNMRVVPFSGIEYTIWHTERCEATYEDSLDPCYSVILDRLQWKQVEVSLDRISENNYDCPGFVLLKKILDGFSDALEKLSLRIDREEVKWFHKYLPNWTFSRLQTLELEAHCTEESSMDFGKAFVVAAPILQELRWLEYSNFTENILEGSSAVLVPYNFRPLYQQVCESLMGALRPETIKIYVADYIEYYDRELLNGFVPKVLQVSHTSLKTLGMDFLFAVPLMCYGICLENVTKLKIRTCSELLERLQQPISNIVRGFDFTRIFPKLTQVRILNGHLPPDFLDDPPRCFFSESDISGFVEQGSAVLRNTLPDRAHKISQLELTKSIWESSLHFWAQMFPHVQKLTVVTDGIRFPFHDLLEYFVHLEELIVEWDNEKQMEVGNLDSAFCGIFPAEVCELRGKDDEYLKAVNIVPVKPSISCMRGLRSLICKYTPRFDSEMRTDSTLIFSKVTAWIAFARCPSLTVTIEANSKTAEGLRHMESYVNFSVEKVSMDYESDDDG